MPDAVLQTTLQNTPTPVARPWTSPRLAELPKLTALTLASAIGGGGGTGSGGSTVFGLLLAVGLAVGLGACSGDRTVQETGMAVAPVASQLLTCTVHRDQRSLTCDSPSGPSAAAGTVTIGSQGKIVGLRSTAVSWNSGTDILSATVTVDNNSVQPMGTTDGTTLDGGIDVFFVAGPVGPIGQTVGLPNAEGPATFTHGNQYYFHYDEVVAPSATSAGQTWEFALNGVSDFTFAVLVSTKLPSAGAFLNWWADPVVGVVDWHGVAGWGTNGLAIFGGHGIGAYREGGAWLSVPDHLGQQVSPYTFTPVAANGPREIFTVMIDGHTVRYWDGVSWRSIDALPNGPGVAAQSIASAGPGSVYVGREGVHKFTLAPVPGGGTWSTLPDPTGSGQDCRGMYGISGRIYCSYADGSVYSWDGAVWTSSGNSGITSAEMIFASDTNDVWVYKDGSPGVLKHYSGGSWTSAAAPINLSAFHAYFATSLPNGEAYITGSTRQVWHWDGSTWNLDWSSGNQYVKALWGRDADTVYALGTGGLVMKRVGGIWSNESGDFGPASGGNYWRATYVAPEGDVFLGASGDEVRHWKEGQWSAQPTTGIGNIGAIWGSSATDVYAGGPSSLTMRHFNGTSWSNVTGLPGAAVYGISGTGPGDVWTAGYEVGGGSPIRHFNGVNWQASPVPDINANLFAIYAVSPSVAIAVGAAGLIYTWDGTSWSAASSGTGSTLRGAWGSSATDLWAVGTGGTIRHWNGASWGSGGASCDGGADLYGIWGRSATEIYAVSTGGRVCFYNGTSWSTVPLPDYGTGALYAISGDVLGNSLVAAGDLVFRATR